MTQLQTNHPYRLDIMSDTGSDAEQRVRSLCYSHDVYGPLAQTLCVVARYGSLDGNSITWSDTGAALARLRGLKTARGIRKQVKKLRELDLAWLEIESHNWGMTWRIDLALGLSDRNLLGTREELARNSIGTSEELGRNSLGTERVSRVRAVAGDIYPDSSPVEKKVAAVVVAEDTAPAATRFAPDSLEMFIGETVTGLGYEPFVDEALERIAARVRVGISDEGEQRAFIEDTALKIHTKGLRRATLLNALLNDIDGWLSSRAFRQELATPIAAPAPRAASRQNPHRPSNGIYNAEHARLMSRFGSQRFEDADFDAAEREERERLRQECRAEWDEIAAAVNGPLINPSMPFDPVFMLERELTPDHLLEVMQELADEKTARRGGEA